MLCSTEFNNCIYENFTISFEDRNLTTSSWFWISETEFLDKSGKDFGSLLFTDLLTTDYQPLSEKIGHFGL
jgi:hypothetical protein